MAEFHRKTRGIGLLHRCLLNAAGRAQATNTEVSTSPLDLRRFCDNSDLGLFLLGTAIFPNGTLNVPRRNVAVSATGPFRFFLRVFLQALLTALVSLPAKRLCGLRCPSSGAHRQFPSNRIPSCGGPPWLESGY